VAGPSLEILKKYLDEAIATNYIPYEPTLGQYVTVEEAATRYANLKAWYEKVGHFWVGSGPFYLAEVRPVEKILVLKRFENYPDPAEKWLRFAEPRTPTVEVSAPAPVLRLGAPWDFIIEVTFKDQPYPLVDMDFVMCLLFDAEGNLVYSSPPEAVKDGLFVFSIPASLTATLPVGPIRIEAAAVSKLVAIPAFAKAEFTAVK